MGVTEIYDYLKSHKGFHSTEQIAANLDVSARSIRKSINTVARYDDILCEYQQTERKKTYSKKGIGRSSFGVGKKSRKAWVYAHVNQIKKPRS